MGFFPENEGGGTTRELIPAKVHEAYCYGVIDMGTQKQRPFKGQDKPDHRDIMLLFEFTEEKRVFKEEKGEEPMVKSFRCAYYTDEKSKLAKLLAAWLNKKVQDVDFAKLAGTPASITITHDEGQDGKVWENFGAVTAVSEKLIPLMPPMHNKPMNFSITLNGFDSAEFKALYPWIQEKIKESAEYKTYAAGPEAHTASDDESDLPFDPK